MARNRTPVCEIADAKRAGVSHLSALVTIITPEIASGSGGLADYTLRLIEQWHPEVEAQVLAQQPGESASQLPRAQDEIVALLETSYAPVLVQYSAYGYDDSGVPKEFIEALVRWKSGAVDRRMVVMFHEVWTFLRPWNRSYMAQRHHRRLIGKLAQSADCVFTSTESQATHLKLVSGRSDIGTLPVGSNVPVSRIKVPREEGTAVLLGLEASRMRVLRTLATELRDLATANRITRLETVGGRNSPQGLAEEKALLSSLSLRDGFTQLGQRADEEVANLFARASFAVSTQDPLSYTKSGTLMAYAEHGLNVISSFANPDAGEPSSLFISPRELVHGIMRTELDDRANRLRAWQARTASWPAIAARFLDALGIDNLRPVSRGT